MTLECRWVKYSSWRQIMGLFTLMKPKKCDLFVENDEVGVSER